MSSQQGTCEQAREVHVEDAMGDPVPRHAASDLAQWMSAYCSRMRQDALVVICVVNFSYPGRVPREGQQTHVLTLIGSNHVVPHLLVRYNCLI